MLDNSFLLRGCWLEFPLGHYSSLYVPVLSFSEPVYKLIGWPKLEASKAQEESLIWKNFQRCLSSWHAEIYSACTWFGVWLEPVSLNTMVRAWGVGLVLRDLLVLSFEDEKSGLWGNYSNLILLCPPPPPQCKALFNLPFHFSSRDH